MASSSPTSLLEECSHRQVAQSLWACAKLHELQNQELQQQQGGAAEVEEDDDDDTDDDNDRSSSLMPPDMPHARVMAQHLAKNACDLSTKDVVQTLWAIARLQLLVSPGEEKEEGGGRGTEDKMAVLFPLEPLLEQAERVVPLMTAQEVSMCLWSLSKMKKNHHQSVYKVVFPLTQHILQEDEGFLQELRPSEAVTILYSLGLLDLREETVFQRLSQFIFEHVDGLASPSVAHVLHAHQMVHLTPPQGILDAWASKKLGLVPVSTMKSTTTTATTTATIDKNDMMQNPSQTREAPTKEQDCVLTSTGNP